MSGRKRDAAESSNDWLGLSVEDEDEDGSQSDNNDDIQDSRSRAHVAAGSTTKRRKLDFGLDSDSDEDSDEEDRNNGGDLPLKYGEESSTSKKQDSPLRSIAPSSKDTITENADDEQDDETKSTKSKGTKKLSAKALKKANRATAKSGVIYLSRIPPFMNVLDVKRLISPYGSIGRVFLTPEDSDVRRQRKRSGGSSRPCFVDGWIEFTEKHEAKNVAQMLNTRTIGGSKRGFYHDDVWNIRYLSGFKWHHLTEQIANENAARAARLRSEISHSTKENKRFVENIEKAKVARGIEGKRREKGQEVMEPSKKAIQQHFAQNKVHSKAGIAGNQTGGGVLSKIF